MYGIFKRPLYTVYPIELELPIPTGLTLVMANYSLLVSENWFAVFFNVQLTRFSLNEIYSTQNKNPHLQNHQYVYYLCPLIQSFMKSRFFFKSFKSLFRVIKSNATTTANVKTMNTQPMTAPVHIFVVFTSTFLKPMDFSCFCAFVAGSGSGGSRISSDSGDSATR